MHRHGRDSRSHRYWLRLMLAAFFVVALRAHHPGGTSFDAALGWLGVAACATGIGIATWARVCLGRNWGMPMTVRARPTLVRSGPYRVVRHPIYSGLLLAALGSALVDRARLAGGGDRRGRVLRRQPASGGE